MNTKLTVNILDPDFEKSLKDNASQYQAQQQKANVTKWNLSKDVNDWYPEHAPQFAGDKQSYYVECSRVANDGLEIALFGESGQTLRRWCEVQATWDNFPEAYTLLEVTSFDHLAIAKRAAYHEKTDSPLAAMDWALKNKASADDMTEHYFPPTAPTEYDKWAGAMSTLLDIKNYEWINSADIKEKIFSHVKAIETIKADYLEKKGLAE
jgi:hypothetical protein